MKVIAVDGLHSVGKSTLIDKLYVKLKKLGFCTLVSKGSGTSNKTKELYDLKKIIYNSNSSKVSIKAAWIKSQLLINEYIKELLTDNPSCEYLILDRTFPTREYIEKYYVKQKILSQYLIPDLTYILIADKECTLQRLRARKNDLTEYNREKSLINSEYESLYKHFVGYKNNRNVVLLDTSKISPDDVLNIVCQKLRVK